jgi:hypothetical protein
LNELVARMHGCPNRDTRSAAAMGRWAPNRSVAARSRRRRLEGLRALVAEEVVAGEDVVDLQAVRAGVALADVALEERIVANDGSSPSITQETLRRGAAARLAGKVIHREIHRERWGHALPDGEGFKNYST